MKSNFTLIAKSLLAYFFLTISFANAQSNQWVWQAGSSTGDQPGVYGQKGVPDYNNTPGARQGAATWTDKAGNFWMFGGYGGYSTYADNGINYYFSDMWKFDPTTTEWVWISGSNSYNIAGVYGNQGIAAAANLPGSRQGATTWVDATGNFWMFGGQGYDSTTNTNNYTATSAYLNDLWMYNPTTNQWTWVSGSQGHNIHGNYERENKASGGLPGGRYFAAGAIDVTGNVWIFGGEGYDALSTGIGNLNDLWEYVTATNQWIWQSGSNQEYQFGNYGTQGTGSTNNIPGSKHGSTGFCDDLGNFYVFGGVGYTGNVGDNDGETNDLWKYTTSNHEWTWVNGTSQGNQHGVYGTLGSSNPFNTPGGREGCFSWLDSAKNFWVFGGFGQDSASFYGGNLSDLWQYSLTTNQWAWMGGSRTGNTTGLYGTLGTPSANNLPGARSYGQAWVDASHNLWLFGGTGNALTTTSYQSWLTDVWELGTPSSALPITLANLQAVAKGTDNLVSWQTATEINSAYFDVQRSSSSVVNFTTIGTVKAAGNSDVKLSYSFTDVQPLQGNNLYRLKTVDKDGKISYSNIVSVNRAAPIGLKIYPNPVANVVKVDGLDANNTSTINIISITGNRLSSAITSGSSYSLNIQQLAAGTYYLQVTTNKTTTTLKFVKQ